ncbi:MAG: nucleoside phosphorylase [Cryomorphaceae bacterium]|nr:nucleoside phosphorylase [Cryomorphaceae bacterium]
MKHFPPTELALNAQNHVYHLGLSRTQIGNTVLLVGDQDRVSLISNFFETIEHKSQHREFVCHTGTYRGKRISALSTGIGTDNIDITVNELDALVNIDLTTRTELPNHTSLNLIRIGTCGILQPQIPVHSYIVSTHAFGLDNVAHFYDIEFTDTERFMNEQIKAFLELPKGIEPYFVGADSELTYQLTDDFCFPGITITSSGFYGPQGRQLRLNSRIADIQMNAQHFNENNLRLLNFEMESSALFSLGRALGHRCATICLGIANRPNTTFSKGYNTEMNELIKFVLDRVS